VVRGRGNKTEALAAARKALCARLQEGRADLEESVLARIKALPESQAQGSPEYVVGLRSAVSAALDCSRDALAQGQHSVDIPPALLVQARLAACHDIGLDTVLQRCYFGHILVTDFCIRESAQIDLVGAEELQQLVQDLAVFFERLIAAVTAEHVLQTQIRQESAESGDVSLVRSLLAGKLVDFERINYEFDPWHLGVVAFGTAMKDRFVDMAAGLDRRVLVVPGSQGQTWAWFGGRREMSSAELERSILSQLPPQVTLTAGEPAQGVSGWRLSHQQALATVPIAKGLGRPVVRYVNYALLASMLQDDVLIRSLKRIYLAPLDGERDGGGRLRQTLHAYVAADGHISSAAAALGVSRKTVSNRLGTAEERIGMPLASRALDLGAALLLDQSPAAPGSN
jgi:hypothetical protein